jgi:hypothetical protein
MSHHAPSPRRPCAFATSTGFAASLLLAATCVTCVTCVTPASAAEPTRHVELSWSRGSPDCLGRDDLVKAVEATLGAPVFHEGGSAAGRVEGRVGAAAKGGFEAHMILRDLGGAVVSERRLDTDGECRRLDEPIAVVVALMIDALGSAPSPLSVPAEPIRAPALPARLVAPPPARMVAPPAAPSPSGAPSLAIGVGLGLDASLLPGTSLAAVLRGELAPIEALPLAWTAHFHGSSSTEVGGFGGRFSAWTTTLAACPTWSWARARARLGLCGSLGAGALSGTGVGLPDGLDVKRSVFFAGLGSHAAVHLAGPLWARVELGVDVPFRRDRWGYVDAAGAYIVVHRPAAIVPNGLLTLEFRSGQ